MIGRAHISLDVNRTTGVVLSRNHANSEFTIFLLQHINKSIRSVHLIRTQLVFYSKTIKNFRANKSRVFNLGKAEAQALPSH